MFSLVRVALLLLSLSACVGPPAPDSELCRDVIERVCASRSGCSIAATRLDLPAEDCVATMAARTGCDVADFAFSSPSRDRVLECRLPLVRETTTRGAAPSCDFIDETFRLCPDLVTFFGGKP